MIMIWLIGYIIGMILTLLWGLWYYSVKQQELCLEDVSFLLFAAVLFPIGPTVCFIAILPRLLYKPASFILKKMKKWRKKHDDR